jgi:predicted metal-binding membrane protein
VLTRSERSIIAGALAVATFAAWFGSWLIASGMRVSGIDPAFVAYLCAAPWSLADLAAVALMWIAMMAAMMLPSAGPMVNAFATIAKRRRERGDPYVPTAIFVLGYLLVWSLFSVAAALLHWALAYGRLLGQDMAIGNAWMVAGILLLAGLYQLTPLKEACLTRCRSPSGFILSEWREGYLGSIIMGFRHGLYCVGCCWALMLIMFVISAMDLRWTAAFAIYVAAEKLLPAGPRIARLSGYAAIVAAFITALIALFRAGFY